MTLTPIVRGGREEKLPFNANTNAMKELIIVLQGGAVSIVLYALGMGMNKLVMCAFPHSA